MQSSPPTEPVVEARELTKYYPRLAASSGGYGLWQRFSRQSERLLAVDHLDFSIGRGEIFGLLGPNGAGKTTTIKMLCGLLIPDEGAGLIGGLDIQKEPLAVKRSLGVLLDNPERGFILKLSGRDNLEFFASVYGMARVDGRARVSELLHLVGLQDSADEEMQKYSRGMKQKLAISPGRLPDPPVIILDEPTLGLDPQSAYEIRTFIRERLKEEGRTVLLTTHNMQEVERLCDRVAIVNNGSLIALDSPENIAQELNKRQIIEIHLGCESPAALSELRSLPGVTQVESQPVNDESSECIVTVWATPESEVMGLAVKAVLKHTDALLAVSRKTPSFEEVFIDLVSSDASA